MRNRFNRLISLQEASKQYNKHESTLRTLIERSKFVQGVDCMKYGRTWVFNQDALDRFYGINKKEILLWKLISTLQITKSFSIAKVK